MDPHIMRDVVINVWFGGSVGEGASSLKSTPIELQTNSTFISRELKHIVPFSRAHDLVNVLCMYHLTNGLVGSLVGVHLAYESWCLLLVLNPSDHSNGSS